MKTTTKKYSTKKNNSEPKKDSFIEKIIENLDLVSAKDWEFYSAFVGGEKRKKRSFASRPCRELRDSQTLFG